MITATLLFFTSLVLAAEGGAPQPPSQAGGQPYIDQLKKDLPPEEVRGPPESGAPNGEADPYIQSLRKKLPPEPNDSESYIEKLKRNDPEAKKLGDEGSFTEQEKSKLAPSKDGGAIAAVNEGHSDLEGKREGAIRGAAGFRLGTSSSRQVEVAPGVGLKPFNSVYPAGWVPDFELFYEYQPFHSEWFGNLGFLISTGVTAQQGTGTFEFAHLVNPVTGVEFGAQAHTEFHFITVPTTLGVNYRFNLLRVLRPYVQVAGVGMIYAETRNDDQGFQKGDSLGVAFSGGVNILLDWLSSSVAWDLYDAFKVKHYYLTVDYTNLRAFTGDVHFTTSQVSIGMTYEF